MSETRIPGRNGTICVIGGETRCITGVPDPPDDPKRWHAPQYRYNDIKARYKVDDNGYDEMRAGPIPSLPGAKYLRWRAEKVHEWEAHILKFAARVPKR